MTVRTFDTDEIAYQAKLGASIIAWNHLEALVGMVVYGLAGGGKRTDVLAAHMNSVTLSNVLETLATDFSTDELKPYLLHLNSAFDRLRDYRNYYFHGVRLLGKTEAGEVVGLAETTSARGRLTLHQSSIASTALDQFQIECDKAITFGSAIISEIWGVAQSPDATLPGLPPEMPPLPDKLQKPRLFLLDEERRLPASQE